MPYPLAHLILPPSTTAMLAPGTLWYFILSRRLHWLSWSPRTTMPGSSPFSMVLISPGSAGFLTWQEMVVRSTKKKKYFFIITTVFRVILFFIRTIL